MCSFNNWQKRKYIKIPWACIKRRNRDSEISNGNVYCEKERERKTEKERKTGRMQVIDLSGNVGLGRPISNSWERS